MLPIYARKLRLASLLFLGCSSLAVLADLKDPDAGADKKKKDPDALLERAPVPSPVKLTVNRGETVEITLNALTASNKDVQFILRTEPKAGKLLDPEPVRKSKTSATLRYQADPKSTLLQDEIKFAVRIPGGNVSPAETVSITLKDIKPELNLPERIEGGAIRCGQSTTVVVPIRNVGNGTYSQVLQLPSGWAMAQGDRLTVPAGKSLELKLIYTPTTLGATQNILALGAGEKSQTTLTGTGLLAVEVPYIVNFKWDPATSRRTATVPVRNALEKPVQLKISGTVTDLDFPKEAALAAGASSNLQFVLLGEPSRVLNERIQVTVQGLTQDLELQADRAPAQIVLMGLSPEGTVDFGKVPAQQMGKTTKSLTLTNRGGTPVTVFGTLPESFVLNGFTEGITVQPGMEVPILVHFAPTALGSLKNSAQIKWDKNVINLTILATIIPDAHTKTMVPDAPTNHSADPQDDLDPLNASDARTLDREMNINRGGLLASDFKIDPAIPVIEGVYVKIATEESLTLAWKAPPVVGQQEDYNFVVLNAIVRAINGYPRIIWVRFPKVVVTKVGDEYTALLRGIGPGWANQLRVSAKGKSGLYGQPSIPQYYGIPAPPPPDYFMIAVYACSIIGVGLIFYLRRRARKNAFVPRRYAPLMEGEVEL